MGDVLARLRTPPGQTYLRVTFPEGFTIEQMKKVDVLKKQGACDCGPRNSLAGVDLKKSPSWLCKTMCGTLLAPGAKDGDASTRVPNRKRKNIK